MEPLAPSQSTTYDDIKQLSLYIDNVNKSIQNIDIQLNNSNTNILLNNRSIGVINEKENDDDSISLKKTNNPFIRRYQMKKKFSTVISPFDVEQRLNSSNNVSNTICNNNTSFFNKRNLSHNFDDTIFNEVSELILKANQEIKENKALNTESNLPSQRSYKPSKEVSNSPKKKKPIKLLLSNNVLKKSTEDSPIKHERMVKKKSSRNIAIPNISPIQISSNTSQCNTYNHSISKSKKKPISSSVKMNAMTHRSQNSTILNGSFVINSMKKSLYKKYNTNTQQNSVMRNSSKKKNNISNAHKNIISTFNITSKNEHNKAYLTNSHNSKNKNNNLFINHHKNKTSIMNRKPKEKIINFDKSINYKNIPSNQFNDLMNIFQLINNITGLKQINNTTSKQTENGMISEENKIVLIQNKWREYYIRKKMIKDYRIGKNNTLPKITNYDELIMYSKMEYINHLANTDKNFKDLLYMMNKVNELYIKCTKNKKFVTIKNILNNNQSISAQLSSIVKGNLKMKNPKTKYKK